MSDDLRAENERLKSALAQRDLDLARLADRCEEYRLEREAARDFRENAQRERDEALTRGNAMHAALEAIWDDPDNELTTKSCDVLSDATAAWEDLIKGAR